MFWGLSPVTGVRLWIERGKSWHERSIGSRHQSAQGQEAQVLRRRDGAENSQEERGLRLREVLAKRQFGDDLLTRKADARWIGEDHERPEIVGDTKACNNRHVS